MRWGRRDPVGLRAGDPLDFWRVEAWKEDRLLRLCAQMKVPGRAWLQFEVEPTEGSSRITQGGLRSARARGAPLLVQALPDPLVDLPTDAAGGGGERGD